MSVALIITFKAGKCEVEGSGNPQKIKCLPIPGYLYLFMGAEDELLHFCWRPRSKLVSEPELDLIMFPGDATFQPYTGKDSSASSDDVTSPTNGRIYALKFSSSSQRHLFWLQSKPQSRSAAGGGGGGNNSTGGSETAAATSVSPGWFSPRDLKLGQIVDMLLSGNDVDVQAELSDDRRHDDDDDDDDDDDMDQDMDDVPETRNARLRANSTGGAGADATGGDIREEGEESREGGADGGRAVSAAIGSAAAVAASSSTTTNDTSNLVQNFLDSLKSGGGATAGGSATAAQGKLFTTLGDLLTPETCIPILDSAPDSLIDSLLSNLPPSIILLEVKADDHDDSSTSTTTTTATAKAAEDAIRHDLSPDRKRAILRRVFRSPQLHQSLGSLTMALRDGGLPTVAEALRIPVQNGGYVGHGSGMPLGGGEAVEAFLEGIERTVVQKEGDDDDDDEKKKSGDSMDTST